MQIHLVLNKHDRLAFQFHHVLKSGLLRQGYWLALIVQFVILRCVLVGFKLPSPTMAGFYRESLMLLIAAAVNHFEQYYEIARKIRKIVWENAQTRMMTGDDNGDSVVTLTPEELVEVETKDQHVSRYQWNTTEGVYETAHHIFVYYAPDFAGIIPKRGFPSEQEAQRFLLLARQYWQQANPDKQPDLKVRQVPWAMRFGQSEIAPPVFVLVIAFVVLTQLVAAFTWQGKAIRQAFKQAGSQHYETNYAKIYRQAEILEAKENWNEAAKLYQQLIQLEPKNPAGHIGLAAANGQLGNYPNAETSYRAALALDPESARAAYGIGYARYRQDQPDSYDEAEKWFMRCLQKDPQHLSANYFLGRIYQEQGKETEAAQRFRVVLKEDPFSERARESQRRLAEMRRQHGTGWFVSMATLPSQ